MSSLTLLNYINNDLLVFNIQVVVRLVRDIKRQFTIGHMNAIEKKLALFIGFLIKMN